jgi:PAS domain S-box-containing protein
MNIFALSSFLSIFIGVFLGTYIYAKDPSNKLNKVFFLFNLLVAYSAFCEYFRLTAQNEFLAYFWLKASFLLPFFPIILLKFVLVHTKNKFNENKILNWFLFLLPSSFTLVFLFTDLLKAKLVKEWYGWDVIAQTSMFSNIIELYFVLVLITTIFLLVLHLNSKRSRSQKGSSLYILIGFFITPFAVFISHALLPSFGYKVPPLESLSNLLGSLFIAIGILKYKFFIIDPLDAIKKTFETIGDYMLIVNNEGEILLASTSFVDCSNYSKDEIIGTKLNKFIQINDENISKRFYKKRGTQFEVKIKTNTDSFIPISVTSSIVHGSSIKDKFYLLLGRDLRERKKYEEDLLIINKELENKVDLRSAALSAANLVMKAEIDERKEIEQSLRESEKKYRELIENATEIIYLTDADGHIIFGNDAAKKISGYTINDTKSRNYYDFIHPEYKSKIKRAYYKQFIKKEQTSYLEFPIITKDGKTIWWAQSASLIMEHNKFKGFQIIARDITKTKLVELALVESEMKYKNIFDFANIGIYQSELGGKLKIANQTFANILGYDSVEEILKQNIREIYYNEEERTKLINKHSPIGSGFASEVRWKKEDGSTIWIQLSSHAIKDQMGNIKYFEGFVTDITDRKKAEDKLQLLAEAVRGSGEGISITDLDNKLIFVNESFLNIFGYEEDEIIGKNINFLRADKKLEPHPEEIRKATIRDGWSGELLNKKKDGTLFPISLSTSTVFNDEDEPYALVGITKDITEIKSAQKALVQSEERYRSIFEYTSAVMLLIDPTDGSIKGANKAACDYYGYKQSEFLKMNISQIKASKESISKFLLQTKDDNNPKEFYSQHKLVTDEVRDVAIHIGLIKINEKDIIFSIIYDITERRKAEKEVEEYQAHLENLVTERTQKIDKVNKQINHENKKLKIAERNIQDQLSFLQTLLDTIPNPIFICNAEKYYTGCNKAFEIFHGITKEELQNMTVYQLTNKEIGKFHDEMDDELLKNRGEQKFETTIYNVEGVEHDAFIYKATFDKADGSVGGIVGILLDITEIKKMEKEILRALEKEKELSDLKSRFISIASHEFRTPLTTILSSADLLEMYGKKWPDEKYYKFVGNIQNSVEYMTELINDVLTVSKSEAGKIEFHPQQTNLYELLKELYKNAKLNSPQNIKFVFEYNVEKKTFMLDSKLLTQIISNLLSNAVKYSPEGGEVSFIAQEENKHLYLSVIDSGIGIPEEDQSRLFEPFHRANNVGAITGTGLGLSIAQKSAEIMGGELIMDSKINKGTKISVALNLNKIK